MGAVSPQVLFGLGTGFGLVLRLPKRYFSDIAPHNPEPVTVSDNPKMISEFPPWV